jgi:hypothetical protein
MEVLMQSIDFFAPVTYNNQTKTISQQALEIVDEYFYLGDKFRVQIFPSNGEHPQFWSNLDRQGCDRSWPNRAIKIASYCTLILPMLGLLIKAFLRLHLQTSTIPMRTQSFAVSKMEAMPVAILEQIIRPMLSYKEQGRLAQVGIFSQNVANAVKQRYITMTAPLKQELQALPADQLTRDNFQRLLVGLVTSPAAGHPIHWIPLVKALIGHLPLETDSDIINTHAYLADLLATAEPPISPSDTYRFLTYLEQEQLSDSRPWICYRVFEQYLLREELDSASVSKVLKKCLNRKTETYIDIKNVDMFISNNRLLRIVEVCIDTSEWFGSSRFAHPLWRQMGAETDVIAPMPEILVEVLGTHIQSLRNSVLYRPFSVKVRGSSDAPYNFLLPLGQHIVNAKIHLWNAGAFDHDKLGKPQYGIRNVTYADKLYEKLALEYPRAVHKWRSNR